MLRSSVIVTVEDTDEETASDTLRPVNVPDGDTDLMLDAVTVSEPVHVLGIVVVAVKERDAERDLDTELLF
jgi:hypothetical protein